MDRRANTITVFYKESFSITIAITIAHASGEVVVITSSLKY